MDVDTSVGPLSVVVEGLLVQRGTRLLLEAPGRDDLTAEVESDYLAIPLLAKLRWTPGPVGGSLVVGPVFEYLLRTRVDPLLAPVYDHEKPRGVAVTVGVGLEALVRDRAVLGVDLRFTEGLGAAYDAPSAEVRHRSVEMLFRVGVRPTPEAPPP